MTYKLLVVAIVTYVVAGIVAVGHQQTRGSGCAGVSPHFQAECDFYKAQFTFLGWPFYLSAQLWRAGA